MASAATAPQSVGRIFAVLELLGAQAAQAAPDSRVTLSALARECDAPKASLLALLNGMLEEKYLVHDEVRGYRPGPRLHALAVRLVAGFDFLEVARPAMAALVEATGETVLLGVATTAGDRATYIAKVESANPVRYTVPLGEQRELYCSASGKLLLAWRDGKEIDRYLASHRLKAFTPRTITDRSALMAELRKIRAEGLAETREERIAGASALAVPVLRPLGELAAALTLAGPADRIRAHRRDLIPRLRATGQELTRLLADAPEMRVGSAPR